jgi:hypothetical protein
METALRWLFRVVTFLFAVGGIGCVFVLILTSIDDLKMLFERPTGIEAAPYKRGNPPRSTTIRFEEQDSQIPQGSRR